MEHLEMVDDSHCAATLRVEVTPRIRPEQAVLLSLYEWSVAEPATYLVDVPPRTEESSELILPLHAIKPGEYLVRLVVDGAESPLGIDQDPDSPTFNWYDSPRILLRD